MSDFSSMCNDVVSLVKNDGTVIEKIKAIVQTNKIYIFDAKLPLEENDIIFRNLPNGLFEKYIVEDRGYIAPTMGIEGHYQAKVRKEGSINKEQYKSTTIINNINSTHAKVNINSTDNSNNTITQNDEKLFDKIINALDSISEINIREQAIKLANEMKANVGKPTFKEKYQNFISTLTNYVTIISPFLPALTSLL